MCCSLLVPFRLFPPCISSVNCVCNFCFSWIFTLISNRTMAQTPLQPNYLKVFIQRDYSEGKPSHLEWITAVISEKITENQTGNFLFSQFSVFPILPMKTKWNFIWSLSFDNFRNLGAVSKQISRRAWIKDWQTSVRENDIKNQRILSRGWEGQLQYILRRILCMFHCISYLHIHRDTLREGMQITLTKALHDSEIKIWFNKSLSL